EQKRGHVTVEAGEIPTEFTRRERPEYFVVRLDDNGTELVRSASLGSGRLAEAAAASEPQFQRTILPDGRNGRLVTYRFTPRVENEDDDAQSPALPRTAVITLARDTSEIDATLSHL